MEKKLSPLQAIKDFCIDCNGEVKGGRKYDCLDRNCQFYPWKDGKGNYEYPDTVSQKHKDYLASLGNTLVRKQRVGRVLSEEQKAAMKAGRLKKRQEKENNP